jgi:hypothetical protein
VRPFTKVTIVVLFVLIVIAAIVQFTIGEPEQRYPGPVSGTPLPTLSPTP